MFDYKGFIDLHESSILKIQKKYNINDIPALLGQLKHESKDFKSMVENLNYSVPVLLNTFKRHRITLEQCYQFGRKEKIVNNKKVIIQKANQKELANIIYGGDWGLINLGNSHKDDGWTFRGRTWMMCTGRSNYKRFSDWMGIDFIKNPDKIIEYNWDFIGFYWMYNKLNDVSDDIAELTQKINGGLLGIKERFNNQEQFKKEWKH